MNLDDFIIAIRKISKEDSVQKLIDNILEFKIDDRNAIEFKENIEQIFKESLVVNEEDFDNLYSEWTKFKNLAIDGIGGMTMNERLYSFALFEVYEDLTTDFEKNKYYNKLMAKR